VNPVTAQFIILGYPVAIGRKTVRRSSMTASLPTPLRWTEEAEAEAMCALAVVQREPQSGAVRVAVYAAPIASAALLRRRPWPLNWLASLNYQITRDGGPRNGLIWLVAKLSRQA
jgi:hypothetical protein